MEETKTPRRKVRDADKATSENTAPPLSTDPSGEAAPPLEWYPVAEKLYPEDDPRFVYPDLQIAYYPNGEESVEPTRAVIKHTPSGECIEIDEGHNRGEVIEAIRSIREKLNDIMWRRPEDIAAPEDRPSDLQAGAEAPKPQILDPYSNTSVFNALIQEAHSLITQNIAEASIAVGVGLMLQAFGHTEISISADALRNFYIRFQTKRVKQSDGSTLISIVERK